MKNQVTSIGQSKRLIELGVPAQKAVKAYCHDCCCTVVGECGIGSENCIALRDFIQKLNEDEND